MKTILFFLLPFSCWTQQAELVKNKQVVEYVSLHGREISPTYESAVCTELVIAVLEHFTNLTKEDKSRIRIITKENVFELIENGSPVPKGVYYALTENKKGEAVENITEVKAGDFVQFWYDSWGHCGIVDRIDLEKNVMFLHSSFPSTSGYGVQEFIIPEYAFFVRLK